MIRWSCASGQQHPLPPTDQCSYFLFIVFLVSTRYLLLDCILGEHPLPIDISSNCCLFCCCWSNPTGRLVLLTASSCCICWSHLFDNQLCVLSQIETPWCSIVLIFSGCFVYLAFCLVVPILRWQICWYVQADNIPRGVAPSLSAEISRLRC